MKRFITFLVASLMLAGTAYAGPNDFYAAVYKLVNTDAGRTELVQVTSGVTYEVLTVNTDTRATTLKFGNDASVSKTNPVTTTVFAADDKIKFRVAGATSVDLIVTDTAGGYTATVEGFSTTDHRVVIDQTANKVHHGIVRYSCTTTNETDTGVDFAYDTNVQVVSGETTDAGSTLDVGLLSSETSGDADGFLDGIDTSSTGYNTPSLATSGTFMDDATNYYPSGHYVTGANAKSLTFTCDNATLDETGYIHYYFTKVR